MDKPSELSKQRRRSYAKTTYLFALTAYRSTGDSSRKLLFGCQINNRLPTLEKNLKPQWPDLAKVHVTDHKAKAANCYYYNRHQGARSLPILQPGCAVRVKLDGEKEWRQTGFVTTPHDTPRSYVVQTPDGRYRRTRKHLQMLPSAGERHTMTSEPAELPTAGLIPSSPTVTHSVPSSPMALPAAATASDTPSDVSTSMSGRVVIKPVRYREWFSFDILWNHRDMICDIDFRVKLVM